MDHDHQGLLQAILDDPDADGLRLIYADWLEERGDPRGEFIRVQCELAGLLPFDPRRGPLRRRAAELLALYEAQWVGPLWSLSVTWRFRRGFVEQVSAEPTLSLAHLQRVFEVAPVQSLKMVLDVPRLRALAASPIPARLRVLELTGSNLDDEGAAVLASCPGFGALRMLCLAGCRIGPAGVGALASTPHLARLTFLDLGGNGSGTWNQRVLRGQRTPGNRSAEALGGSDHLGLLEVLFLRSAGIGDAGARVLVESSCLPRLRLLLLDGNYAISDDLRQTLVPRPGLKVIFGTD